MTDEELWIAQGRARDAAKVLKHRVFELKVAFDDVSFHLKQASDTLKDFIEYPAGERFSEGPLKRLSKDLPDLPDISDFIERIAELRDRVRSLQNAESAIRLRDLQAASQ